MMARTGVAETKAGAAARWWMLRVRVPEAWRKPLKVYAAGQDSSFQDIVAEAVREWAERRKVELPPAS